MALGSTLQKRLGKELPVLAVMLAVSWASGCDSPPKSDQQIRQQAAQATAQAKQEAQQAAANARVAAAEAERKVDDIAAGVKEGLHGDAGKPAAGLLDLNTASVGDLAALPGISLSRARQIVAARPYSTPHQIVSKGLVSEAEYDRISGRVMVR